MFDDLSISGSSAICTSVGGTNPLPPNVRGPTVSGERPFSYVGAEAYSGLSRPVSTWTPGPIVDDTVIFFK